MRNSKSKKNKKKNVRFKYVEIEDGEVISEDSESDRETTCKSKATDSAVNQNANKTAVIKTDGSKGIPDKDQHVAEDTHPADKTTKSTVTQNASNSAVT